LLETLLLKKSLTLFE